MTDRKRDPLPEGYQFRDARFDVSGHYGWAIQQNIDHARRLAERWRPLHLNAADRIARRQFTTDRDLGDEA